MSIISIVALVLLVMTASGFHFGRLRAIKSVDGVIAKLHSLPNYYGYYVSIWTGLPALILLALFGLFNTGLVDGLTSQYLRRESSDLSAQLERRLDSDSHYQSLQRSTVSLAQRTQSIDEEMGRLRNASAAARDPERLEHLGDERIETLNLSTAAQSALREHRSHVAEQLRADATADGAAPLVLAGYALQQAPRELRQLFISDVRKIADGQIASREAAELNVAAELMQKIRLNLALGVGFMSLAAAIGALLRTRWQVAPAFRARNRVEQLIKAMLLMSSAIAILTTLGIVASLLFESLRFFADVSIIDFVFGTQWSPQIAIREDQVGQSGAFGAVPLFAGTMMITVIAMFVAVPIGLFAAVYLSEYAGPRFRATAKPVLEILAGIPTVVYGFFALLTVGPAIRTLFTSLGFESVVTQSALSAGLVMGIMIIPFISSLSDDVINAVPQSLRDGSYAMGATRSETVKQVILPAALPGIVGAVLLAVSRAIGETMIVVMAAGQGANLTANPLESVTTITVQIVMLLTGDQEFDSPKTLSAFALGLVLFAVTLVMNIIALRVVQKYREKYD
jgi:phosphate transport system permease protein